MSSESDAYSQDLAEHFFRKEYGKMVSVITKYVGVNNVQTAEDIVQETLLKAVDIWQHKGIPPNPQAWLYTTAKNNALNLIKRKTLEQNYATKLSHQEPALESLEISDELIQDEQLKMMFACCHPSVPENSQIALILKILCGFSISEIANAFFSSNETINKRLVRGRKQLQEEMSLELHKVTHEQINILEKTIYLLFNEGYSPTQKNDIVRFDLCLEAIRLARILALHKDVPENNGYALLALMYFNASRFEARVNDASEIVEMKDQDRTKWNQDMINHGIHCLDQSMKKQVVSKYLILATISAQHCIAKTYNDTNWTQILVLYDDLLKIENSPITRLNRSVALSLVQGNQAAINELVDLAKESNLETNYLYHTTLSNFYKEDNNTKKAIDHLNTALSLSTNDRDKKIIEKKLTELVPIS